MLLQSPAPPASSQQAPAVPAVPSTPAPDAAGAAPAPAAAALAADRVFGSEAGIIFNAIKPAAATEFEGILNRLKQALASSTDPVRQRQAASWRIFKASEPGPNGSVLYIFVVDPAVPGASYSVAKILAEAYPAEALDLYRVYIASFAAGQTLLNLAPR